MTKIKLAFPITVDGATVNEISLRRPTVKDMRVARITGGKDDAAQEINLIANLAQITPDAVESFDMADFVNVQKALAGFFGLSETTV
jgi:hypothetical protein